MPAAALSVVTKPATTGLTLYDLEDQIQAMCATEEGGIPPELEQQFLIEFQALLNTTAEKRDSVGRFLQHLEAQIAFAKSEIARLHQRQAVFERMQERLEQYVVRCIRQLGTDGKGKLRKLEGTTITLAACKCPPSIEITDENAVPMEYVTWSFKLPAELWEPILDALDIELRLKVLDAVQRPDVSISKTAIKAAIEEKGSVPGACIVNDKYRLVVK
jgi:Siphovirus Gp157